MKTSKIIAAAALSILAVAGAQAETYDGVHSLVSANSRAEVNAAGCRRRPQREPVCRRLCRGPRDGSGERSRPCRGSRRSRGPAHRPNQNLHVEAFANSVIPAQYSNPRSVTTRQAGL